LRKMVILIEWSAFRDVLAKLLGLGGFGCGHRPLYGIIEIQMVQIKKEIENTRSF